MDTNQTGTTFEGIPVLNDGDLKEYLIRANLWASYLEASGASEGCGAPRATSIGDGNMNLVARVECPGAKSLILKQGPPFVQKYPSIPAPSGRSLTELEFYRFAQSSPDFSHHLARLHAWSTKSSILMLEDVSPATPGTVLYDLQNSVPRPSKEFLFGEMVRSLAHLHGLSPTSLDSSSPVLSNNEMRQLNFEHMFALPFRQDNGLDLDNFSPGLKGASKPFLADTDALLQIAELGTIYTGPADVQHAVVLHGDFFLGAALVRDLRIDSASANWSPDTHQVIVIDFEFCFLGPREFDLGVFAAHLLISGEGLDVVRGLLKEYERASGATLSSLVDGFAGVEIARRFLGVAQLPWLKGPALLQHKSALLVLARQLLRGEATLVM